MIQPHLAQKDNKAVGGSPEYRAGIRSAVRGLWNGNLDYIGFIDTMVLAIRRNLTRAWHEGARACGINPEDLTMDETNALYMEIATQIPYLDGFADSIMASSKARKGKLSLHFSRAELWVSKYDAVYSHAMSMACGDKKLKWVWSPLKEHCPDCQSLNGRVYRASIWRKYAIIPKMRSLACGGWRCGCKFEITTDPVTPGRPPSVR